MTWFIDKLYIQQTHEQLLPLVGDKFYYVVDGVTGETSETPKAYASRIQASHSTSIGVYCDGHKVRVEGNPSRFGRPDNLMGLTQINDCVAVYNRILLSLGLPPFTTGKFDIGRSDAKGNFRKIYSGAQITLIDITRNHSVGHKNELAFLRGVATLSLPNGKRPHLYPNGLTVDWQTRNVGGSSWDYSKVYVKSADLLDHKNRNLKGADTETEDYYQNLIDYCCQSGVVREEHSFKSEKLKRYDLCYYGYVSTEQLANHHTLTTLDKLIQTLGVATVDFTSIASQLLNEGIVKSHSAAYATQAYCQQWLNGQPFHNTDRKKQLSSAYYKHKSRLLQLGIDISVPFCPSRASLPTFKNQREITMRSLELPTWYRAANARLPFQLVNGGTIA